MAETKEEAAARRGRWEVEQAAAREPGKWDERRIARVARDVTDNIITRGEDWRAWRQEVSDAASR